MKTIAVIFFFITTSCFAQQAPETPNYGNLLIGGSVVLGGEMIVSSGNETEIHILQLGDSIADGTNSPDYPAGANCPMAYYVGDNYTTDTVNYVNLAVGGHKFVDIVNRQLSNGASLNPDVVFVHCGSNDISWTYTFDSAHVQPYITAIYNTFANKGIHVYFSEVMPRSPGTTYAANRIAWNSALATWCSSRTYAHVIECYDAMEDDIVSGDLEDDYDSGDGHHINPTGNQYMGGTVWYSEYAFPQP